MNWLGFFSLGSAWLALLLVPLVLVYFLKLRRPRQQISSLALWYQVINDQRVNSPFQKFKRNLLLLLQILVLACLILAAMQPFLPRASVRAQYQPVLIDCSASMGALDAPGGERRLDAAKKQVLSLIDNLLPDQRVALIAFHSTARRLTDFTDNKTILKDALAKLDVVPVPSQTVDALRMTQALAHTVPIERVLMVTDGNVPADADFELPFDLVYEQIPPGGPNMGITAFNARRSGLDQWEVFVGVEGSGTASESSGKLELFRDGVSVGSEPVLLVPGRTKRVVFRIESASASSLEARLTPDGFDSLEFDNAAFLQLPKSRPLTVFVPSILASFRRAFRVQKGIELVDEGAPTAGASFDVLVSDRPEDVKIDSAVALFVGFVPKDLAKLVSVGKGSIDVVDWERSSPLLAHVTLSEVTGVEQPRSAEGVRDGDFEKLGYAVLASGRTGPLLLERRVGVRLEYYLLFHVDRSTLPFRVGFPILASNLLEIGRLQAGLAEVRGSRTGVLPPLQLKPRTSYRVTGPQGNAVDAAANESGVLNGVSALAIGQYRVTEGSAEAARVGVSLLDSMETSLASVKQLRFRENQQVAATNERIDQDRPLWPTFALAGLGLLLVEWWYFQRRPGGWPET
jgi:Ca-activated chloride channel family protein